MKLLSWLGWVVIILLTAAAGAVVGAIFGMVAGPTKVISWLNEDVSIQTESSDSI